LPHCCPTVAPWLLLGQQPEDRVWSGRRSRRADAKPL